MINKKNRVALISGGASGIGRSIATRMAENGILTSIVDINIDQGRKVAEKINYSGGKALSLQCDISKKGQAINAVKQTIEYFGCLDIVVNSAGICPITEMDKISQDEWDQVIAVNLTGSFLIIQAAWEYIVVAGEKGRIINIGSLAGQAGGIAVGLHYTASKGGLIAMTKQLAKLLAPSRGTANCISPGTTATLMVQAWPEETRQRLIEKIPLGRLATPEDVAAVANFLVSEEAQYITGATINVNGGMFIN